MNSSYSRYFIVVMEFSAQITISIYKYMKRNIIENNTLDFVCDLKLFSKIWSQLYKCFINIGEHDYINKGLKL